MPRRYLDPRMMAKARRNSRRKVTTNSGFKYLLHHTLEYDGSGFWGRPTAFYMVGCMTYDISFKGNRVIVSGTDGNFHTSALHVRIVKPLAKIFGSEYFQVSGFPMGSPGISNKLWMDFEAVGAKPFTTVIHEEFTSHEWRKINRRVF